ncbi:MAG: site-specific integrase [Lachnospiraceae bacterium]|nr:site-specific integrase [Lachnospiraceae bacterium]
MTPRLRETTLDTKQHILRLHILPYFKQKTISEISAADIRTWQNSISEKKYSSTYLKSINNQLSAVFNYAVKYYGLSANPCTIAGSIGSGAANEMNYWRPEEYTRFRRAISNKKHSFLCFEILYWTGIREGELLALTPKDIDIQNGHISITKTYTRLYGKDIINPPKTKKSRRNVPIPQFLLDEIREYIASTKTLKDDRLFPFTNSLLIHEMDRGCKISDVKHIRIHDLRHSHASLLISQGFDIVTVSRRLGHENVSTTLNIYSHMLPHKQNEIIDALEKLNEENCLQQ